MHDVELRYNLLEKAKDTLLRDWEQRIKVEEAVSKFENRPPKYVRQPTLFKIMTVAEKWYAFVKQQPTVPAVAQTPAVVQSSAVAESPEE